MRTTTITKNSRLSSKQFHSNSDQFSGLLWHFNVVLFQKSSKKNFSVFGGQMRKKKTMKISMTEKGAHLDVNSYITSTVINNFNKNKLVKLFLRNFLFALLPMMK